MHRACATSIVVLAVISVSDCGRPKARSDSANGVAALGDSLSETDTSGLAALSAPPPGRELPATSESRAPVESAPGRPSGPGNALGIKQAQGADTLRGIVRVVGSAADEQVIVRPDAGGPMITLLGDQTTMLGRLSGVEIWVSGVRNSARSLTVDRFLVRAVDGIPAMDGKLVSRDGGVAIVTTADHAEHPIVNPPSALRARVGSRVWLKGTLETGAVTFGVIGDS